MIRYGFHFLCQALGVGAPGDPKVNFWILVGYLSGYWSGECLGPGNFDNWTCAVQEHVSTTLDAKGSAERFFALLRTTHAYNLTCLLLIHQVRVSVLGVHCIGFHEFKA